MTEIMNKLNVTCSTYGNHDYDLGMDKLVHLLNKLDHPWILANAFDKNTNKPLGAAEKTIE